LSRPTGSPFRSRSESHASSSRAAWQNRRRPSLFVLPRRSSVPTGRRNPKPRSGGRSPLCRGSTRPHAAAVRWRRRPGSAHRNFLARTRSARHERRPRLPATPGMAIRPSRKRPSKQCASARLRRRQPRLRNPELCAHYPRRSLPPESRASANQRRRTQSRSGRTLGSCRRKPCFQRRSRLCRRQARPRQSLWRLLCRAHYKLHRSGERSESRGPSFPKRTRSSLFPRA